MPGPFVVEVHPRPNPFEPGALNTWVGDRNLVQIACFALAFDSRSDAEEVAHRFPDGEVRDTSGMMISGPDSLIMLACVEPEDLMAHMTHSPSMKRKDREKWVRMIRTPDERCPKGEAPGRTCLLWSMSRR